MIDSLDVLGRDLGLTMRLLFSIVGWLTERTDRATKEGGFAWSRTMNGWERDTTCASPLHDSLVMNCDPTVLELMIPPG